jgi:hypothetical protein
MSGRPKLSSRDLMRMSAGYLSGCARNCPEASLASMARLVSVAKRKIALRHGRFYGCSYVVFCLT